MRVRVRILGGEEREMEMESCRVQDLLERMHLNRETVVVKVNERICPEGEQLSEGDRVLIIPIVTGG